MEILSATFYPGPNRHVLRSAMEVMIDLKSYAHLATTAKRHFVPQLLEYLPGLGEHYCSRGHRGGFRERLQEGTYLGHVVEHVALECLYLGGERGVYGKTREVGPTTVRVVFESETARGGRMAVDLAVEFVREIWESHAIEMQGRLAEFRQELSRVRLGPSTRAIVQAARRADIPVARLDDDNLIRLGQGVRQRRIMASMSDKTAIIGVEVAQDKQLAARLMHNAGLPVPISRVVDDWQQAQEALGELPLPLVLKPLRGHHGQGVVMHIDSRESLRRAFDMVSQHFCGPFVLEQQVEGTAYRLLVVGQQCVAATERRVPEVVGDGVHSVDDLIRDLNRDERRGSGHGFPMSWVVMDVEAEETLREGGWTLSSIPPEGQRVPLRRTANMSTGASARDVTHEVSPALARDAVRAAHAVGLDIAGIDVVTPRLDLSLSDAQGAVVEVNAAPGLRMHLYPAEGTARPVAQHIIRHLFPHDSGRIPVAAITGTNGKTTVTRMLGHMCGRAGYRVGMSTTDGISIGGQLIKSGDLTGPWSAQLVLNDPTVEVAVLETARGGMARGGLGFEDVDVAVVTNVGSDHLGQDGIETLADLIHLKALIVDVVRPQGKAVLNADDANVLGMQDRCLGSVVLFSTQPQNPEILAHRRRGGEAVYVKQGYLYYGRGDKEVRLIGTRALPASLGGVARINIANAAAAAAAGLALGLVPRQVADGLRTFPAGGAGLNRGRLEMLEGDDVRVLVDYGHNVPAITALGDICRRLRPKRIVTVLGLPGDRRDDDISACAQVVAGFSHHIVIREDADLRGRQVGEVADLIRQTIARVSNRTIKVILNEGRAVHEAIVSADPGTLILVLYEHYHTVRAAAEEALAVRRETLKEVVDVLEHA